MAVIALGDAVIVLGADAVCGDDRHGVRHRVALHRALPLPVRVEAEVVRLRADGGRIEQDLGALQHHGARGFRVPLVPANADADRAGLRLPRLEAGVAGAEVVFLLIAGAVGDVALAIDAEDLAVGIGDRHAVVIARPILLEEGDRDHHLQRLGERGKRAAPQDARAEGRRSRTISGLAASGSRCPGTAPTAGRSARLGLPPRAPSASVLAILACMSWP